MIVINYLVIQHLYFISPLFTGRRVHRFYVQLFGRRLHRLYVQLFGRRFYVQLFGRRLHRF